MKPGGIPRGDRKKSTPVKRTLTLRVDPSTPRTRGRVSASTAYGSGRTLTLAIMLSSLTAVLLALPPALAQKRRPRRPATSRPSAAATDYSKFLHTTAKHQGACNTCHKIPTRNSQKVRNFPDVADYPSHDACVACHRPQFFKGAKPAICNVCHSKVSPRDDARFSFRNPSQPRQFNIEFPHDRHQDVIARLQRSKPAAERVLFVRTSLNLFARTLDDKAQTYNNCAICHGSRTAAPIPPPSGWVDGFVPDAASFKSVPDSHSSCFNCHWKSEPPVNDNCAGCHKPAVPNRPADLPNRISVKFKHEGGGERKNHVAECTTCHINITKATSLRGLKPDVPITSCTECHNKEGLRQDVSKELVAIDKDRNFVCIYCHTSNVGKLDPPASHYLIAERPPVKRNDIK